MSFLDKLLERAQSFLGVEHVPDQTQAVIADRFDHATFEDMLHTAPTLDSMIQQLSIKNDYVPEFIEDLWQDAFKADPQHRDAADMAPTHVPNHTMIRSLSETPQFQALRANTRGDEYGATMATLSMRPAIESAQQALAEAKERAKEAQEAAERAKEAQQQAQQATEGIPGLDPNAQGPQPDPNGEPGGPGQGCGLGLVQQAQQTAQDAAEAAANARSQAEAAADLAATGMAAEMKAAAEAANDALEEETAMCHAYGIEDGELKRMSFEERRELAQRLRNNRLSQFYKLLGQFKMVQQAESRRKVQHASDEVVGVKLGDNLQRLIPAELLNLATQELETDFWQRWADHALLEYDLAGKEKVGKGPVIVVVDESGSMEYNHLAGGTAEAWSKALALALCDQARQKGRDFHYIGFSSSRQQWTLTFKGGKTTLDGVLTMAEHFFNGGTSYEEPLREAMNLINTAYDAHGLAKPDIVFITDDEYGAMDERFMREWQAMKDKTQVRCFGIALCTEGIAGALQQVSDNVRSLNDVSDSDPRVMADVFRTV